ncbi:unnamed protein product [Musa textilis]
MAYGSLWSMLHDQIPVIRRYSGAGTVIVDDGTSLPPLSAIKMLQPYPHPICHGPANCIVDLVTSISAKMIMHLITTSLVEMGVYYSCLLPISGSRSHVNFLCRMKEHVPSRSTFYRKNHQIS